MNIDLIGTARASWYIRGMRKSKLQNNIQQVVDQIVDLVNPVRVILFGSAVTGRMGADSDLDFLVVVPESEHPGKILDQLNTKVRNKPMPCDFLVVTASRLKQHQDNIGLIYGEIFKHGREIYAA